MAHAECGQDPLKKWPCIVNKETDRQSDIFNLIYKTGVIRGTIVNKKSNIHATKYLQSRFCHATWLSKTN